MSDNSNNDNSSLNEEEQIANDNIALNNAQRRNTTNNLNNTDSQTIDDARDLLQQVLRISGEAVGLNQIKSSVESLNISESGKIFFDRQVKPLVDTMYFLSLSSNSIASTAQVFQGNTFGKKREMKQALDLSYSINLEMECIFSTLRKRLKDYRCGVEKELGLCKGESCEDCDIYKQYKD